AVARLRQRKCREAKPFAVMVKDVETAARVSFVSDVEAGLLRSAARPIVLLAKCEREEGASALLADAVAPGRAELGLFLPYTPLHHLLLEAVGAPLVMTSGNRSDEPIARDEADALANLRGIADLFLVHDRPIQVRCDDSIARVVRGAPALLRRSRGYVPLAI